MTQQTAAQTVVHVVRHGEVHNPEKVLYGRAPGYFLSARGEEMAARAAEYLGTLSPTVAHVVASPLERAQQTAQPIAKHFDLSVESDDRLLESQNFFAGKRVRYRDLIKAAHKLRNPFRPSWDEPYVLIAARMSAALHAARQAATGQAAVLVSHQLPIWILRRHLERQKLWHSPRRRQCALGSVTSFSFTGDSLTGIDYHVPAPELVAAALADDRAARGKLSPESSRSGSTPA